MAKQTYTDIDELVNDLINDLSSSLGNEIGEEMKKIEQESIDSNVYGAYSPKEYERRGKGGGIGSEGNMEVTVTPTGDGVTIELHNSTTGNSLYKNYWQGEIQDLILEGRYMWNGSMPPPRDFITPTQEKVDAKIESIVESALNKLGW